MKESTKNSALVQELVKKSGRTMESMDTNVGNNGYALGQTFHATGALNVVETTIGNNKVAYIGVETKEGAVLSLKSLMGVSSLKGYETENAVPNESRNGREVVTTLVTPELIPDFDFDSVYQPSSRNYLDFIADCEPTDTKPSQLEGATITYLGTVVRPFVARNPNPPNFSEKYQKGDKRAISVRLWQVEGPNLIH